MTDFTWNDFITVYRVTVICSSCSIYLKQSQYVRRIHLISLGCCFYWSERVKIIWQPNKSCEIFFPINDALLMRRLLKVRSQHMRHFKWGKKELIMASWIAQMYRTQMHKYINHKKIIKNHINHCQTRFFKMASTLHYGFLDGHVCQWLIELIGHANACTPLIQIYHFLDKCFAYLVFWCIMKMKHLWVTGICKTTTIIESHIICIQKYTSCTSFNSKVIIVFFSKVQQTEMTY